MIKFLKKLVNYKKINTLENEVNSLKETIKDELYKEFMNKLSEAQETTRLKKENKKLRLKIKELKAIIKEDLKGE